MSIAKRYSDAPVMGSWCDGLASWVFLGLDDSSGESRAVTAWQDAHGNRSSIRATKIYHGAQGNPYIKRYNRYLWLQDCLGVGL